MKADHLAKEADRLLHDDVLQQALADMRQDALETLVKTDPTDTAAMMQAQSLARAVDEFRSQLRRYVIRGEHWQQEASPFA